MVKHTQTIRRQIAEELFECVWSFCEIGAKRVKKSKCAKVKHIKSEKSFKN